TEKGVYTVDPNNQAEKLKCRAVEGTFESATFNPSGLLMPAFSNATVDAAGEVTVAAITIAQVTVEMGTQDSPYAPPPDAPEAPPKRHLQVLMEFNSTDEYNWGLEGLAIPFSPQAIQDWAQQFDGASFVVIGRTCDIGDDDYNKQLAQMRAD